MIIDLRNIIIKKLLINIRGEKSRMLHVLAFLNLKKVNFRSMIDIFLCINELK